ncbi:MAG: hypothetical protein KBT29_08440 [Prevotellaceae bacterium]|nr:hypothetical protein [Candidatus Minthosoma caballi]
MNNKEKLLGVIEMVGETLVVIAAAAWIVAKDIAAIVFAVGTVVFVVGRFFQTPSYAKYSTTDPKELTLRRLHHQRVFGAVALVLTAAIMNMPAGFYFGVWMGGSSWLLLFVMFVVIEVYTVFRISSVDKG